MATSFKWWRKPEYPERTPDHGQAAGKLYHLRLRRPRVTSDRDDRALQLLVRRMPFATSPVLKQHWLPNRRLSTTTVRNRLKSVGLKSRRVITADYSIVVAHLTSNSFEGLFAIFMLLIFTFVPCLLRMNTFFKTPDLDTQIRSVNILNFE
jgi:hypothetical protein